MLQNGHGVRLLKIAFHYYGFSIWRIKSILFTTFYIDEYDLQKCRQ